MTKNALEICDVYQAFRTGFWMKPSLVLHGLGFSVPEKTIFGFLGANGAGKTTLIHLIVGLKRPVRGSVSVFGLDARSPEARAQIGYLPERPYFHEHLTGEGLLRYFGSLSGMSRSQIESRIPQVLANVGMSDARHKELKNYSKGMLQRIGIAQALLHDPKLLVLDEPMSGLDPVGRKEMRELILELASEGRTIFFSSHVIPDVEAICDQVVVIQKGKLIGSGPVHQFLNQDMGAQTEIGFVGLNRQQIDTIPEFLSCREAPDVCRALVSGQQAVHQAVVRLLELKATIVWVTPIRPSLENLFFKDQTGEQKNV